MVGWVGARAGIRYYRQQEMRWTPGVPIDPVAHRLAAADVVGNVFDIRHRTRSGRNVHACNVDRIFSRGFRAIHVNSKLRAVTHRHFDVALFHELDDVAHRLLPAFSPNPPRWSVVYPLRL